MIISIKNNKFLFLIIITFVLSRVGYYFAGIEFEVMLSAWQFFPVQFYKEDLINSIFYNFSQPPLLNFLLGLGLKIGNYINFLHSIYLFFGLLAFINFYRILNYFLNNNLSCLISIFLMIMPLTILWENHGYKDYLTMCFLINSFYYSLKIINKDKYKQYFFLGINIILLCLLRETFHFYWVLIFVIFEFSCNKRLKKSFFLLTLIILFIFPFYLKNLIIFNKFQIAGWMYENLTQKVLYIENIKRGEHPFLKRLIFRNDENFNIFIDKLSPIRGFVFQSPRYYKKILNYEHKYAHPLLHSDTFHNEVMLKVDDVRKKDLFLFLKYYPETFFVSILNSLTRHYFNSSENFLFIENNAKKIPNLIRISHCLKLTMLCFLKNEDDNYARKNYSLFTIKDKIIFSLQQINFLIFFLYFFMLYQFVKFFFSKFTKNKEEQNFVFWAMTTLFMLFILLIFEDTEIPRHRFPYEYLMLVFSLYFYKKNKVKKR